MSGFVGPWEPVDERLNAATSATKDDDLSGVGPWEPVTEEAEG